jgi:subtilase family serine protease
MGSRDFVVAGSVIEGERENRMIQKFRAPRRAFGLCVLVALATVAFTAAAATGASPARVGGMQVSPQATPAGPVGDYGLFSCQVGRSTGQCYDPYQMRKAYGVDSLIAQGYDGTGKTIVILDAFQNPNMVSQLNTYDTFYGLPAAHLTQVAPDGLTPFVVGDGNMTGWAEEISLDVEWAHAIAPGANIVLELATDNSDDALLSAFNDAVNNNRGDVISMSFGEAESCAPNSAWHAAFANATKKGITLFASSGDQGASQPSCDGTSWIKSASSPASDPLVTSVGGTELHAADFCLASLGCNPATNPAAGTYLGEIAWNEGPTGDFQAFFGATEASGGGYSTLWSEPSYQQGTIHGGTQRAVPDVAYNGAILHGVLTRLDIPGVPPGMYRFGGTSCGSPQWAAIMAIADQAAGHDYGFINSALYKLAQTNAASAFNDVTSGNNSAVEFDSADNEVDISGYDAGPGWDAVTGLGSPKVGGLIAGLAGTWGAGQGNAAINQSK